MFAILYVENYSRQWATVSCSGTCTRPRFSSFSCLKTDCCSWMSTYQIVKQSYMNTCFKTYQQERKEFKDSHVIKAIFNVEGHRSGAAFNDFPGWPRLDSVFDQSNLVWMIWQETMFTFLMVSKAALRYWLNRKFRLSWPFLMFLRVSLRGWETTLSLLKPLLSMTR